MKEGTEFIGNASFQERLERLVPLTLLPLLLLVVFAHILYYCHKENCVRHAEVLWAWISPLLVCFARGQFLIAVTYGAGVCVFGFMTVYCNSDAPGLRPPLPWNERSVSGMSVSYGMAFLMGVLAFGFGLRPDVFHWVHPALK